MANGDCVVGAKNKTEIEAMRREQEVQDQNICAVNRDIKRIRQDISEINQKMAGHRPTWPVAIVLSVLATLCGSMAVYIIAQTAL